MGRRSVLAVVILIAAFGIRLAYVEASDYHAINDAGTYNRMASMVANYGDYRTGDGPRTGAGDSRGPTAYFPPAFPYALAVADLLDGHEAGGKTAVPGERVEMVVLGTLAVAFVYLVALEAFGEGVALVAMAMAAVYPVMVELSGTLVAENLIVVLELAAAWAVLRAGRAARPTVWLAGAGVLTGLAALTHENAILYLLPFGIGAFLVARRRDSGDGRGFRALAAPGILVVCCVLMIAPWTIRNAVELHHFVPIADETGITLAGTYNSRSADDPLLPYKWHLFSHVPALRYLARRAPDLSEVQLSDLLEGQAIDYVKRHPSAPLQAGFDNTRRMLELEGSYAWRQSARAVDLDQNVARVGVFALWVVAALALAGVPTAPARRAPRWLWLMPVLWWLSIVLVNVETPRFREPIDPFFILLGACAVTTAAARIRSGLGGAPVRRRRRPAQLAANQAQLVEMVKRLA